MERFKFNVGGVTDKLFRLKTVGGDFLETQLKRCLTTLDITLLGVGHMIGAGVYVLTGAVVRNKAGPGITVSFLLAGIASLLSALCYAEFGARVPKAGSAYTYTYVTIGEFWAFIIGWNILLEHMLGAAAVARSWSGYLDSLLGHAIQNRTVAALGENMADEKHILGDYPDLVAFLVVLVVAIFMGYGAKTSTQFNSVFTVINMLVITFVIVFGMTFADFSLWTEPTHGGFMPFGFGGVIAGAASCFFAYVGFDGIATAGEEASDPAKSIPRATMISMAVVTISYILMSSSLTLMIPYSEVHPTSAFADAFEQRGASWAKYVVAVGALSGMTTSLVGSMFALPRCVYAMASDGLIFRFLAHIHPKTQVPTVAVMIFAFLTALIAMMFNIETLVEFLSIGTLMAYTIVSGSVIILRYQPGGHMHGAIKKSMSMAFPPVDQCPSTPKQFEPEEDTEALMFEEGTGKCKARHIAFKAYADKFEPGVLVSWSVLAFTIFSTLFSVMISYGTLPSWWGIILLILFSLCMCVSFAVICIHQQGTEDLKFKVPFVPLLPALSILVNVIFMTHLSALTWLRLAIWLAMGLLIYFLYGMEHSSENPNQKMSDSSSQPGVNYNTMSGVVNPDKIKVGLSEPQPSVTLQQPQPKS